MKNLTIIFTIFALILTTAHANVFQDGGDRLAALQNNDGGWDWPLDDGDPASTSPTNTVGPIAMGLSKAYANTNDAAHLTALQNAGGLLLSKDGNFSPSDGYLAAELDSVFSVTTYTDYVKANFYDKLAAGTYERSSNPGTQYDTAGYVNSIRTARSGSQANMAAWDIGVGLYAASQIPGVSTTEWILGTKAEIDELDGANYYDVIGLAGAILGLASVDEDFDPSSGEHASASNINDLAGILASYQLSTGGFAWNSEYVVENDGNETIQETAYAVLALNELDPAVFNAEIVNANLYMMDVQLPTGGWENYLGSGENNEITGEALWAISVPEPMTLGILGLGGLFLRKRK